MLNWRRLAAYGAIALMLAGCTAPQYDPQTDTMISQLQTDVDSQLIALVTLDHKIASLTTRKDAASQAALVDARSKAGFDANAAFYDKIDVELIGLRTRIDAEPTTATPFLDGALQNLSDNLVQADGSMQVTHQKVGILSEDYLRLVQRLVDVQFGALLSRELALKNVTTR